MRNDPMPPVPIMRKFVWVDILCLCIADAWQDRGSYIHQGLPLSPGRPRRFVRLEAEHIYQTVYHRGLVRHRTGTNPTLASQELEILMEVQPDSFDHKSPLGVAPPSRASE